MDTAQVLVETLKRRAREGDREALQTLRERGFFQSQAASEGFPASRSQQRVWVSVHKGRAGDAYVINLSLRLLGPLQLAQFERALETLYARHETLRTRFAERHGELRQFVEPPGRLPLTLWDFSTEANPEEECRSCLQEQALVPFDLQRAPLWRAYLCRLGDEDYVWLLLIHHIIADAWSLEVLQKELALLYQAYCAGLSNPLPPLAGQYKEYAAELFSHEMTEMLAASREYWREKLASPPPLLQLPTDFSRASTDRLDGASLQVHWDEAQVRALHELASRYDASLFIALEALVKVLLYRYSGQTDLVIGTPIAGRDRPELEGQIGLFINILALRDRLDPEAGFDSLLAQASRTALAAYTHREYPFDSVVEELGKSQDAPTAPLFNVLVGLQNVATANVALDEIRVVGFALEAPPPKYDLTFEFSPQGGGLVLLLTYSTALFEAATIERMCGHLGRLLEAVLAEPERPIRQLPLLTRAERQQFALWNQTATPYPREESIAALFARQAAAAPHAVAISYNGGQLTYLELESRANQLAQYLSAHISDGEAPGPSLLIGICLPRSPEIIVGMLAILKLGAAYLPLDAEYPTERLRWMLEDAKVSLVITESKLSQLLPEGAVRAICIDSEAEAIARCPIAPPTVVLTADSHAGGDSLAYVMYTSGSTGQPKGVCIPHYAISRLVLNTNYIKILPQHRLAHAANICFDAATFEIWGALLNGASVHLLTRDEVLDPQSFARQLKERRFDILFLTTALFNRFAQMESRMFEQLEYVLFGGEMVDARWVRTVVESGRGPKHLLHVYGPTESTTFSTWHEVKDVPEEARTVPIGLPLSNTEVHLLDERQQLVPVGIAGELCIGGDGLALGYLGRPELTRERFMEMPGLGRLYRTGDICRRRPDGAIEFIGRLDGQIKLRGFRIEPGEVEAALRREPGVQEAVALVCGEGEHRQLVAYLMENGEGSLHTASLRRRLRAQLPEYMVPSQFVVLDELPLNANGKVDRSRLPAPETVTTVPQEAGQAGPMSLTEELLAGLWCEVLKRESVNRDDDFFGLGGHSILAMQVLSRIRDSLGVDLPLFVIFEQPMLCNLAAHVDALRQVAPHPRLKRQSTADELSLSFAQQRLWFLSQLQGEASATYSINAALRLDGRLDEAALRSALLRLTERQQSLRMNFQNDGGRPVISLRAAYDPLIVQDLRSLPAEEREAAVHNISNEYARRPFDLERDALMRMTLLVFGDEEYVLLFSIHHIIADGWSLDVLVRDLSRLYTAARAQEEPRLPTLAIEYTDYAAWQREWLQGEVLERQLAYWRERLEDAPSLLNLPTDYPRPATRSYRGAQLTQRLEPQLVSSLKRLSRSLDATLFMTLIAGFETLLYRYSGDEDIVVGTPIANRGQSETEGLIGFFTNTLAFRTDLSGNPTFAELVARVRKVALGAYGHKDVPFEKLVAELKIDRALDHSPLFQVMFGLQNSLTDEVLLPGVSLRPLNLETGTAKNDLLLMMAEGDGTLEAVWEYSTDLFEEATIARMAEHFQILLRAVANDANRRLSALPLLSERELLLTGWNQTVTEYPSDRCIQHLFEEAADRMPEQIALISEGEQLTYSELNRRANQLAHYLRKLSVGPEMLTGICMERGIEMIVGLLGILKAGAAYLPLDPAYPRERLHFMLSDASVAVLLSQKSLAGNLPEHDADVVYVDEQSDEIALESGENLDAGIGPDSLAYVMYTSGSTGQPKGVCIPHYAISRLVLNTNYIKILPQHRLAHAANVCFDAATFEIWGALLNGASVHLLARDEVLDPQSFARQLKERRFDILFLTTALFNRFAQMESGMFEQLEYVLFGGEMVDARWVRTVVESGRGPKHLLHVYGPTESTTFAAYHPVRAEELSEATVPIGKPLSNTQMYVLDKELQPVPVGVAGELYIGGDGLSRGYWMRPKLTAQKFIPNPYDQQPGSRLYRTGDICRRRPDGDIEFLGRLDNQVKLRGFRVEPGEIEAVLRGEAGVKEAVVVVSGEGERKHLVAYLLGDGAGPEVSAIQQGLRGKLPEYMVPSQFVVLDELPLNANGKVDRSRLPAPEVQSISEGFVAPQTELERRLADVWSAVLGVERVGRHDNFFELGGDSILSIQIVAKGREQGLQFRTSDLFLHQTVADLSSYVTEEQATASEIAETGQLVPLTPIQRWFLSRELEEPWHFNQSVMLRPQDELSPDVLQSALEALLRQHAALRLRFRQTESGWEQSYAEEANALPLHLEDLSGLPADEQHALLQERATFWQRSLNLSEGPLSRVILFKTSDGQRLLWCIHHLIVDAVSWRIILGDLQAAIQALHQGREPSLPPPTAPFSAWANYLDDYARSEQLDSEAAYWEALPELPQLPTDFSDGEPTLESTTQVSMSLNETDTRSLLEESHRAYNLRINDLLLTALAQTLARWTGRSDCMIELEGHGRIEREGAPDLSRTVGWFTTLYPIHLVLPPSQEPDACLKAIKEQLRAVPGEGLGYGVLRYMKAAMRRRWPDASLAFNYLGQFDQVMHTGSLELAAEGVGESHSRRGHRPRPIDVDAWVSEGQLRVSWSYSTNQYRPETIRHLAESFNTSLQALIAHCRLASSAGYTPSDFPLAALTQKQLDGLAARHGRNIADIYPLSPMQQGMVFHSLYEADGGGTAYFEQLHCRIEGMLDEARFHAAWKLLLRRHPILRTAFLLDMHPPLQIIYKEVALPWASHDWRQMDEQQQARALDSLLKDERRLGFDLTSAPLLRCHLLRLGEESYRFVWCFHHLLLDGWSLPVLFRELFALLNDPEAELPTLRPYRDYIAWLQRQDAEAAASHWRSYLAGFSAPTPVPSARQTATAQAVDDYQEFTFELDEETGRRLSQFRSRQHLTDNTLLQAAWALLLQHHSGEKDVAFGVTVSGRDIPLPGIESMLGLFINTLPLRLKSSSDRTLWNWLQEAQRQHQENMLHGYLPLNEIQVCSSLPGGTPLFDTIFVFENYPMETSLPRDGQAGLRFLEVEARDHTSYPLTFVASAGDAFRFRMSYDSQRFEPGSIERLAGHVRTLLSAIADSGPETRLQDLSLLTDAERQQLLALSRSQSTATVSQTLPELFAAQAARDPDRIAVVCDGESLSYGELSLRARRLGRLLRKHGARPDRLVGLFATRSIELVVGILGILDSGAAYLPLDAHTPSARLSFMLADADVLAVVTQSALAGQLPEMDVPRLYLDELDTDDGEADVSLVISREPQHLAYVIYTSGSTGQPKGVMVTHDNVTRLFAVTQPEYQFSNEDVWTLFHSSAFDFSVWEFWGALLFGGRLVIVPHHISRDPMAFYELLEAERVTVLNQTPSAFGQLIAVAEQMQKPLALRLVIFGGEALDLPALRPWFELYGDRRPELVNMYGITETTVHVTWCPLRITDTECMSSLIGRQLDDLDLYLLDECGEMVPIGVAGEIYVGGAGLARGYLNRAGLTAQRFVPDPFATEPGARLYRTGDLARRRSDGSLEYMGRIDHQVKIRGFRIELGEIESTLSQHPSVREAVVLVRGTAPQQYLAAYIVAAGRAVEPSELRDWMSARLPEYMVPTRFVFLESLPLTVNGKVDRKALPEPSDIEAASKTFYVAPRNTIERQLVEIWQDGLGRTDIGVEHNFFELGGHSLTAMQIASAIYKTLGVRIPLRSLFESPTVASLAALVKEGKGASYTAIEPAPPAPDYPLSHSQLRLWLDNKLAGSATFNMPEAMVFDERLDVEALKQALNALVARHETLRTSFVVVEGKPRQRIHPPFDFPLNVIDLSTEPEYEARTREIIDREANTPFDVESLPLIRVTLIKLPGTRCVLANVIHHIIGDGWSKNVLYHELSILYSAFRRGLPNPLKPLRIHYKDYAVWENALGFEQAEQYWMEELEGTPTHISLPYDFPPPAERLFLGDRRTLVLDPATSQGLRDLAASRETTLSTIMFALFQLFLFQISRQDDLCVGTVVANRHHPDLENQIGCFVNILPVRTRLSRDMDFNQLLDRVIQSSYGVLEHQNYPFDLLLRRFSRTNRADLRPFLDVGYLFQNSFDTHLKLGTQLPQDVPRQEGSVDFSFQFTKFDLSLTIVDLGPAGVKMMMEYDSALFKESTVLGYLNTLGRFAKIVVAQSQSRTEA